MFASNEDSKLFAKSKLYREDKPLKTVASRDVIRFRSNTKFVREVNPLKVAALTDEICLKERSIVVASGGKQTHNVAILVLFKLTCALQWTSKTNTKMILNKKFNILFLLFINFYSFYK
jgi:hypothetical protein